MGQVNSLERLFYFILNGLEFIQWMDNNKSNNRVYVNVKIATERYHLIFTPKPIIIKNKYPIVFFIREYHHLSTNNFYKFHVCTNGSCRL